MGEACILITQANHTPEELDMDDMILCNCGHDVKIHDELNLCPNECTTCYDF